MTIVTCAMKRPLLLLTLSLAALLAAPHAGFATQTCRILDLPLSAPTERYGLNSDATVTDKTTGLVWKRCSEGQSGDNCEKGKAATYNWREAIALAEPMPGWRLPTVRELGTLLEYQCTMPAINLTVFPATPASNFWTTTPYAGYVNGAWNINFNDGIHDNSSRNYRLYVRLVRGALAGGERK